MNHSRLSYSVLIAAVAALGQLACDDGGGSDGAGAGAASVAASEGPEGKAVLVFSDMETGELDGGYFVADGYPWEGAWFTYTDMSEGTITPPEGGVFMMSPCDREGSNYCAHTSGGGFSTWGAGAGFNLKIPPEGAAAAVPGSIDVSSLGVVGVSFYARAGDAGTLGIRAKVLDAQVVPPAEGGTCEAGDGQCQDSFGALIALKPEWQYYELRFDTLSQEGWGAAFPALDPSQLIGVQFQANMMTQPSFDFFIDDVAFMLE